ncbi:MAG: class I SAM-dependent methyltransferase [Spirochaetia bacterium]
MGSTPDSDPVDFGAADSSFVTSGAADSNPAASSSPAVHCPLCLNSGSDDSLPLELWKTSSGERYRHCRRCDFVFLDPKQRLGRDAEHSRYLLHNNSPEDERYVRYLRTFAGEALFPYLKPPARILDFGSGPAPVFAGLLRGEGYTVDIYDPFFAPGKAWERELYDGVTSIEVAEHLFSPLEELQTLSRVLRPGGILAMRTLLHYSDFDRFDSWWYRKDPTHVSFYSQRTFETAAELIGMELVEVKKGRSVVLRRPW